MIERRRKLGSEAKSLKSSTMTNTRNINTVRKTQVGNQMTLRRNPNAFSIYHIGTQKLKPFRNDGEGDGKRLQNTQIGKKVKIKTQTDL